MRLAAGWEGAAAGVRGWRSLRPAVRVGWVRGLAKERTHGSMKAEEGPEHRPAVRAEVGTSPQGGGRWAWQQGCAHSPTTSSGAAMATRGSAPPQERRAKMRGASVTSAIPSSW